MSERKHTARRRLQNVVVIVLHAFNFANQMSIHRRDYHLSCYCVQAQPYMSGTVRFGDTLHRRPAQFLGTG